MSEIGWLHLTDLHIGNSSAQALLPNVKAEFFEDISWLHEQSGPWHVLFFTGDLTQRGIPEEFRLLDEFLSDLMAHLSRLGSTPLLLPVPGNHDLVRPPAEDPRVIALRNWDHEEKVRTEFWRSGSQYRSFIEAAFANYARWSQALPARAHEEWKEGAVPGDFQVRVGDLGIVGLNSAALHLSDDFKAGAVALGVEQIHALSPDPPQWFSKNRANILLTHHPPEWLTKGTQKTFAAEIAPAGRFALHLYGHLHEPGARWSSVGGGPVTRRFQGASLFSMTRFRKNVERIHGYSAGRIALEPEFRLEIWPRRALLLQNGRRAVILDPSFDLDRSTQSFRDPPVSSSRLTTSIARPDVVLDGFPLDRLEARVAQSQRVRMLIMRSSRWFSARQDWLVQRIGEGKLQLEVLMPEPSNQNLITQLQSMYDNINASALAQSIRSVIGRLLEMRSKLPPGREDGLRIATHEYYPPYSAYLFDDDEFWYIPYHRKPAILPVFVYRGRLQDLTVSADFQALPVWWLTGDEWKRRLANHVRGLLDDMRGRHPALNEHLQRLKDSGARVVLFGGFVRDGIHSFVHGQIPASRDLDLIVDGTVNVGAAGSQNHFGGTRWNIEGGLHVDCWDLASTLAFRRALVLPATFANLPRTTVYRLNGCYLDLNDGTLHGDEAIADVFSRRVAFNCKGYLDKFPEYQAFRAIDLADRLQYELNDDVKEFIAQTFRTAGPSRFAEQVREHRPDLDMNVLGERFTRYSKA